MQPSSSKKAAKVTRGGGRFDPSTEARVHVMLDFIVSRIQIVLKGMS